VLTRRQAALDRRELSLEQAVTRLSKENEGVLNEAFEAAQSALARAAGPCPSTFFHLNLKPCLPDTN